MKCELNVVRLFRENAFLLRVSEAVRILLLTAKYGHSQCVNVSMGRTGDERQYCRGHVAANVVLCMPFSTLLHA